MILAALVAIAFGQTAAPTTLSYTNPGARLEVILPELSKLTGMTLRASPEMGGRAVILRLDGAGVKKALEKIAHVTYGTWGTDQGAYVLYRDNGRIATEVEAAKQEHIAEVAKALPRIGTVKPKPANSEEPEPEIAEGLEETPLTLAIHRLVSALDPTVIGTIPENCQLVYSTRPAPLQIGLPNGSLDVFEALLQQVRASQTGPTDDEPLVTADSPQIGDLSGTLSKADIDVQQNSMGVMFGIKLFDDQGKLMLSGQVSKQFGDDDVTVFKGPDPTPDPPPATRVAKLKSTPLELSQLTKDFLRADAGVSPISPALRERLLDPITYDPVSFIGQIEVACAAVKHRQLVASPTDFQSLPQAYQSLSESGDNGIGVAPSVETIVDKVFDGNVDGDGWIAIGQALEYPDTSATDHVDRRRLALAIKSIPTGDSISLLDEVKAFRAGIGDLVGFPEGWLCEKLVAQISQNRMLSLLSTMSDGEIDLLLSGKTLYLGSVSPSFQNAFSQYSVSPNLSPMLENPDGSVPARDPNQPPAIDPTELFPLKQGAASQATPNPARSDDLWKEFTEVSVTYAPPPTSIRLITTSSKSLTVIAPPNSPRHVEPRSFGDSVLILEDSVVRDQAGGDGGLSVSFSTVDFPSIAKPTGPTMPDFGVASEKLDGLKPGQRYRMGTNTIYTLAMTYAPFVCCLEDASTTSFDADSKAVALEGLPASVQKAIRNFVQQLAQWQVYGKGVFQDQSGASGGGGP